MSLNGSEKVSNEKLAAMWIYAAQMGNLPPPSVRKLTPPSRQVMLIPSAAGNGMAPPPPTRMPPPPPGTGAPLLLPVPPLPPQYRGMTLPYIRPGSVLYAHPGSLSDTYRTHKSTKSAEIHGQRRRRRASKLDANRRQRRKSEADVLDGAPNFQYTGLDRAIADSFLARQEQSQAGSHIDYSSSASSDLYGGQRASSTTKIVCRDVVM
ncbi:wiskott-Aldrich syndrome protein homolog isoform X2 [Drosophila eugracilis]|nr:wiskott-Aldrich syndrome protein homolog isoform X2 [Drosophila eugracilis]XP_017062834.1 wiskott-Aldrich syndrome protein homolog isoform X2 [Drosophila eugracilis]XP_017062835.1 wiskott-Aldrich syndrome protein homolog isoform X2 [Drosophila eugracilis]